MALIVSAYPFAAVIWERETEPFKQLWNRVGARSVGRKRSKPFDLLPTYLFVRTSGVTWHRNKQPPLTQISNQAEMG